VAPRTAEAVGDQHADARAGQLVQPARGSGAPERSGSRGSRISAVVLGGVGRVDAGVGADEAVVAYGRSATPRSARTIALDSSSTTWTARGIAGLTGRRLGFGGDSRARGPGCTLDSRDDGALALGDGLVRGDDQLPVSKRRAGVVRGSGGQRRRGRHPFAARAGRRRRWR